MSDTNLTSKKVDYPAAPGNYKYHTKDDLERLKVQLQEEIQGLEGTQDKRRMQLLEEDKRMLHEIECEMFERIVLENLPDGGTTD